MPFSKLSDLPENIQKLSKPAQEQFMATFNSFFADCTKKGEEDCEGRSFAVANSAIKKQKKTIRELEDEELKAIVVPDDIAKDDHRTYQVAYGAFHTQCMKGKEEKPQKCAEGADKAGRSAVKKMSASKKEKPDTKSDEQWLEDFLKGGARNSRTDLRNIQKIHDTSKALGADCFAIDGKAMGLGEQERVVRQAWLRKFGRSNPPMHNNDSPEPAFFVRSVFDNQIIVIETSTGQLFSYPYEIDNRIVGFGEPIRVEMTFTPIKDGKGTDGVEAVWTSRDGSLVSTYVGDDYTLIRWGCADETHNHKCQKGAANCIATWSLNTPSVRSEFCKSAYTSNALKAISETDDELTVGNYIILFGGRDLEGIASHRINENGTKGEYFTKATNVKSSYTETGQFHIDWEHGKAEDDIEPGRDDVLGYVDWKTSVVDEEGIFVQRVLNRRNKYIKFLEKLIKAGMVGTSSEPIQKLVSKATDGQIEVWPFKRDTMTVVPMDPRMLSGNHLELIKSLADDPDFEPVYRQIFSSETAAALAEAEIFLCEIGESYVSI